MSQSKQSGFYRLPFAAEASELRSRVIRQTAARIGVDNCEFFEPTFELLPMVAKKDYSVSQYLVEFVSIVESFYKCRDDLRLAAETGKPTKKTQEKLKRLMVKRDVARRSLIRYLDNKYP